MALRGSAIVGTINHNAIVVTGTEDACRRARDIAIAIFSTVTGDSFGPTDWSGLVSPIVGEGLCINGYASFFVAPDGSKEWWETSNALNKARDDFVEAMDRAQSDPDYAKRLHTRWVEISFGELAQEHAPNTGAQIVRSHMSGRGEF